MKTLRIPHLFLRTDHLTKIYLPILLLIICCNISLYAQVPQRIRMDTLSRYLRPDFNQVQIMRIRNGNVLQTDSVSMDNIPIEANDEQVAIYTGSKLKSLQISERTDPFRVVQEAREIKALPVIFSGNWKNSSTKGFYRPYFIPLIMNYNFENNSYNGELKVFLIEESEKLQERKDLEIPVDVWVTSKTITTVNPEKISIDHTSYPPTTVQLSGMDLIDPADIVLRTVGHPQGFEDTVEVKPVILLKSFRTRVQGLGIEAIDISILLQGKKGMDSVSVGIQPSKGSADPNQLYLKYSQTRNFKLRSAGLGAAFVEAVSPDIHSNRITLTYTFPWLFFLLSLIGGILGGLIGYYSGKNDTGSIKKVFIRGSLIGLIVSVAYFTLGINLIGIEFNATFNELAVLGISALGGYFGIKI